jgi:hypothetical protein
VYLLEKCKSVANGIIPVFYKNARDLQILENTDG